VVLWCSIGRVHVVVFCYRACSAFAVCGSPGGGGPQIDKELKKAALDYLEEVPAPPHPHGVHGFHHPAASSATALGAAGGDFRTAGLCEGE
jgi:hypothetical protein